MDNIPFNSGLILVSLVMSTTATATAAPLFTDISHVVEFSPATSPWPAGSYAVPEITGGGVALFDFDNDSDLDLLQILFPPPNAPDTPAPNRLFAQEADGRFVEEIDAGLNDSGYGQGCAVGDADNDGDLDVFFANFGANTFYRNNGNGRFTETTEQIGIQGKEWSTSAAFVDIDRDGALDLYVVNYVKYDPTIECRGDNSTPDFCGPGTFAPTMDNLYRNKGDGTFSDISASVGINAPGKGLGVVTADFSGDGWADLYIANDGEVNQLWINDGNGSFADEAILRGAGFNIYGQPEASMGVVVGDANGDGYLDIFTTHLRQETNTLYLSDEYGMFADGSDAAGFGRIDLPYTGFGCGFFDYDHDGDLDLAVANGRVKRGPLLPNENLDPFWAPYAEPNLLLENDGSGNYTNISAKAGAFGSQLEVSRGLAFGDLDRDGDIDLVVGNIGGPPQVFRNDAPKNGNHWLSVRTLTGGRDAIGAVLSLFAKDKRFRRTMQPGYSYASSSELRTHFGLGAIGQIDSIAVSWPDGSNEIFTNNGIDQFLTLVKGEGKPR